MNKKDVAFQKKFNKKEKSPKEPLKQETLTNSNVTEVNFLCINFFFIFSFPEDGFFFLNPSCCNFHFYKFSCSGRKYYGI